MRQRKTTLAAAGSAALMALMLGCAKAPEDIAPAPVSDAAYQSWSCDQLAKEQERLATAYAAAAKEQARVRSDDTAGVILLGLPVSSMAGQDIAPQVARLKGEQEAVRRVMAAKNCAPAGPAPVEPRR
jgi:hypothetical protein